MFQSWETRVRITVQMCWRVGYALRDFFFGLKTIKDRPVYFLDKTIKDREVIIVDVRGQKERNIFLV